MNTDVPAIHNLARRLIALDPSRERSAAGLGETVRTFEKLRIALSKFSGVAGYRSLMARAFMIAAEEFPCLDAVQVRMDGSLEGFDAATNQQGGILAGEAGTVVLAQLLGLLMAFVGEPMMMRLVRDAWPGTEESHRD